MADKILVSNNGVLAEKYGAGAQAVQSAIARLISADKGRGLQTVLVPVDDARA